MRLFVAVTPPPDVLRALGRAAQAARDSPDDPPDAQPLAERLRWAQPESWHLTLAFLGEVAESTLPELTARLERAARRHHEMTLTLSGGGRFGDRTLWVGVGGDGDELAHLAASVAAGARRTGIAVEEGRAFRAHVTLARARPHRRTDLRPFVERLAPFASRPWTADRIELIRSHPPAPGAPGAQPRYESIGTWRLGRPGPREGGRQPPASLDTWTPRHVPE